MYLYICFYSKSGYEFNEVLKDFHISIFNYEYYKQFSLSFYDKIKYVIQKNEI